MGVATRHTGSQHAPDLAIAIDRAILNPPIASRGAGCGFTATGGGASDPSEPRLHERVETVRRQPDSDGQQ
jgi:hypothetical protein